MKKSRQKDRELAMSDKYIHMKMERKEKKKKLVQGQKVCGYSCHLYLFNFDV